MKARLGSILATVVTGVAIGTWAAEVSLTMPNPLTTTFTVGSGDFLQSGQESWTLDINSGGVLEVTNPRWETVFQQNVAGTSTVNIATGGIISFTNTTGKGRRFFVGNAGGGAAVGIINLKGGTILGEKLAEFSLGRDGAEGYLNISGGTATVGSLVMGTGGAGGGTAQIDFTAGSTGTLSVVGKDVAFFERLFISGQLTHNGISSGSFTNHFHSDGYSVALLGIPLPEPPPLLPSPPLIDPRFPAEWHALEAVSGEEWARWPRTRIRQLEAERSRLLAAISVLPQHDPIFLSSHLGYHSLFEEPGSDGSLPPHQIVFKWGFPPRLDSIALVPVFNPKEFGVYAFPKRFKIEVWDYDMDAFETVVNWMDEDFPDPGPYPVFFGGIDRLVSKVRITVPQVARESGAAYYALGEIYLFRQNAAGGVADNMAIWGRFFDVEVSDSFSMPPLWDAQYLYDGIVGLGFPLSDETVEVADLMVTYDDEEQFPDNVQITLDLGRVQNIGRIDFWPAAAPYLLALPSFGFPKKITVEMSANPDFKPAKVIKANNASGRMHRENLLSIIGEGYDAQYIRVTMEGLSEYKGKRILGLGEISVSEYGEVLSANCKITAQGIPEEYLDQLPRLVDGYSWQRRILPQGEWIKGLAKRRPLDRRLTVVERKLEQARIEWQRIKQRSGIWAGVIIVMGLVGGLVAQRQMRKRGMNKLKWRITRDLHDEVGSSLGSISLTAEQLKHAEVNVEVKEELCDLSLLAREAWASLREVVWVIDESTIRLPMLIQKLVERAERVLGEMEIFVEIAEDCPDCVVSLPFKRHLIMFFKEVVHNCARHSQATQVWVTFSIIDQCLRISIRDNGCGFDPTVVSKGWGMGSMKERAEEMGGRLEIVSQPGKGTTIVLSVPLANLSKEPDNAYTTSN